MGKYQTVGNMTVARTGEAVELYETFIEIYDEDICIYISDQGGEHLDLAVRIAKFVQKQRRSKFNEVTAIQITPKTWKEAYDMCGSSDIRDTLAHRMGDWLLQGEKGDFMICSQAKFQATYREEEE